MLLLNPQEIREGSSQSGGDSREAGELGCARQAWSGQHWMREKGARRRQSSSFLPLRDSLCLLPMCVVRGTSLLLVTRGGMINTVHPLCSSIPSAVSQSQQYSCFQDPDFAVWSVCSSSFASPSSPQSPFLPLFLLFSVSGIPEGSPVLHLLTHFINEPD